MPPVGVIYGLPAQALRKQFLFRTNINYAKLLTFIKKHIIFTLINQISRGGIQNEKPNAYYNFDLCNNNSNGWDLCQQRK